MMKERADETVGQEIPGGANEVQPGQMPVPPAIKPGMKKKKKGITSISELRAIAKAKNPGKMGM